MTKQTKEAFTFLRNDLERVLSLDPGVNYAAAHLILSGLRTVAMRQGITGTECEALYARLTGLDASSVAIIVTDLYKSLHDGYCTDSLAFGGIVVSWKDGVNGSLDEDGNLVLNVSQIGASLIQYIDGLLV